MDLQQHLDFLKMADVMLVELVFRSALVLLLLVAFWLISSKPLAFSGKFLLRIFLIPTIFCFIKVVWDYRSLAASLSGHASLSYAADQLNNFFIFYVIWGLAVGFLSIASVLTKE